MTFSEICKQDNLAWEGLLGNAYHYTNENGEKRTVFHYQFPFPPEKEEVFLTRYHLSANDRMAFYQNFVQCIQQQTLVSAHLSSCGVPSILTYTQVKQERNADGVTSLYYETEEVWPITKHLLSEKVSSLTLLDIISRLAMILRDINKPPASVIHRGLDLNEVYINSRSKILLGGFFYSYCPSFHDAPNYLPCAPAHIPKEILSGSVGAHKTDIKTLAAIAWNLYSGLPHDAQWATKRMASPEYAPAELVDALLLGIAGEDPVCNLFRRKLTDCRKQLIKNEQANIMIPVRHQRLKQPSVVWIKPASAGSAKKQSKGGDTK